jgi:hypothetical protein
MCVVARPYRNALRAIWTNELDFMKSSIVLKLRRLVRDSILVTRVGLDDAQIFSNSGVRVIGVEDSAAGLSGQFGQGSRTTGASGRRQMKRVDRCI